jgi:hypothetical protein
MAKRGAVVRLPGEKEIFFEEEAMTQEKPAATAPSPNGDAQRLAELEEQMDRLSREVTAVKQLYAKEEPEMAKKECLLPYTGPSLWDRLYDKIQKLVYVIEAFFS